jgi:Zn-dependent protease with chaperone function
MQRKEITNWVLFVYLTLINVLFTFVAWTFWIWRNGILTPEETTAQMIALGPAAVVLDLVFGLFILRFLRRRTEGDSSSSATE